MRLLFYVLLVLSIVGLIGCDNDENNDPPGGGLPTIVSIDPSSISIGQQNAQGTISGTNLGSVTQVDLGEGITIVNFSSTSSTAISVTFSVSPNAPSGSRTVTVTTTGGSTSSSTVFQVSTNKVPVIQFTIDPRNPAKNTPVDFDASATTDPNGNSMTYFWEYGDGATGQGKKTKHTYVAVGDFTVSLKVTDSQSAYSVLGKQIEVSKDKPPVAVLKVRPGLDGSTNTIFIFDGSNSSTPNGRIKDWIFDFGDGKKSRGKEIVEHQYEREGNYEATLTVIDNKGLEGLDDAKLKVEKSKETACTRHSPNRGILFGTVVGVEGRDAIVRFPSGSTCSNSFYYCGDFRKADPEGFYGIVHKMSQLSDGTFRVTNDCPFRWPPGIGERVFLYWKSCSINYCP